MQHDSPQEAISNAVRHSEATKLRASVFADNEGISLAVSDNGMSGGQVEYGNGLRGMEAGIENLGGRFEIGNQPGGGFGLYA